MALGNLCAFCDPQNSLGPWGCAKIALTWLKARRIAAAKWLIWNVADRVLE
jgi:hypothetical protein